MGLQDNLLLQYLHHNSGRTLPLHKIEQDIFSLYRRQRPAKGKNSMSKLVIKMEEDLVELTHFGLIQQDNYNIHIKKPFLLKAQISTSRSGYVFGIGAFPYDIFIPAHKKLGAFHKDQVLIRLKDKRRGKYEGEVAELDKRFTNIFFAKVIQKQKAHLYLIQLIDLLDQPFAILDLKITKKQENKQSYPNIKMNTYVIVKMHESTMRSAIPKAKLKPHQSSIDNIVVCSLQEVCNKQDEANDFKRVCVKYNLLDIYHKKEKVKESNVQQRFTAGLKDTDRRDLTQVFTCTIDGDTAKDFDDAISLEKHKGDIILYVHIADVSYFVMPDSYLDKQAYNKGNSYYIGNHVLSMLPPILSEEYCSLKPQTKRLAFTCQITFSSSLKVKSFEFYKSIIYIDTRYTYNEAETHAKNKKSLLYPLFRFTQELRQKRLKEGGIELEIGETEKILDKDNNVIGLRLTSRLVSSQLIEECMLQANIAAARFLRENKIAGIHRVHPAMKQEKVTILNQVLGLFASKFSLKDIGYKGIYKAIQSISNKNYKLMFHYILLRSFEQAIYSKDPLGHWGLGFQNYTHFTSPIRRYADLVVHRQIESYLSKKKSAYQSQHLDIISAYISKKERLAMEAEKSMQKMIQIRFMRNYIKTQFYAFLVGFNAEGLFIMLEESMMDGFIPLSDFSNTKEMHSLDNFRVTLPKWQKTLIVGTKLKVSLEKIDWEHLRNIFSIQEIYTK